MLHVSSINADCKSMYILYIMFDEDRCTMIGGGTSMKVADQLWVAVASLQREKGLNVDFSVKEILERAREIDPKGARRPGLRIHISKHCVAGKPPNPGNYRMLHETSRGRRRLYRENDPCHPERR